MVMAIDFGPPDDGTRNVPHAPQGHRRFRMLRDEFSRATGMVRCQCGHEGALLDHSQHLQSARAQDGVRA